jgi:hypothetical protein
MSGVCAARVPHDYLRLICQIINDFPLSFIAPLGSDNHNFHWISPVYAA